jgi:hypothetical protein
MGLRSRASRGEGGGGELGACRQTTVSKKWRPTTHSPDRFLAAAAIPIDSQPRPTDFRARMAPLCRPAFCRSPLRGRIHRHAVVLEHHHGRGSHIATTPPCLERRQLPIQPVPSACPVEQERRYRSMRRRMREMWGCGRFFLTYEICCALLRVD